MLIVNMLKKRILLGLFELPHLRCCRPIAQVLNFFAIFGLDHGILLFYGRRFHHFDFFVVLLFAHIALQNWEKPSNEEPRTKYAS